MTGRVFPLAVVGFGMAACITPMMAGAANLVAPLTCVADTQCRGDAEAMCAASTLRVDVAGGPPFRLWIDRQGPYPAQAIANKNNDMHLILDHFGGGYALIVHSDGRFVYRGNRGKRFSGSCQGVQ